LLLVAGSLLRKHVSRPVSWAVSFGHLIIYLATFFVVFAMNDAAVEPSEVLDALIAILGVPFMYLLELPVAYFGGRWWGDDSNLILALAVLNSLTWGFAVAFVYRRVKPVT
jgi:hypothetical protein